MILKFPKLILTLDVVIFIDQVFRPGRTTVLFFVFISDIVKHMLYMFTNVKNGQYGLISA